MRFSKFEQLINFFVYPTILLELFLPLSNMENDCSRIFLNEKPFYKF